MMRLSKWIKNKSNALLVLRRLFNECIGIENNGYKMNVRVSRKRRNEKMR